jgi:transposase-like protein
MNKEDWAKANGVPCPACGQETYRLLAVGSKRLCPSCTRTVQERSDQEIEMQALVRTLRDMRSKNRR